MACLKGEEKKVQANIGGLQKRSFFFPTPWKFYIFIYIYYCRVLEIMRIDAQRDPATFPDALRAKTLVDQVLCLLKISELQALCY